MAPADLAAATDESKTTSFTEASEADSRPVDASKMESQGEEDEEEEEEKKKKEFVSTKDDQNVGKEAADEAGDEDVEYPHGAKLAVILAAICLAVFLVALDQTIIVTAIPKITDQFNSVRLGKAKTPISSEPVCGVSLLGHVPSAEIQISSGKSNY